jgi:hypothetical protein
MPKLTRWFNRIAMLYLLAALAVGALLVLRVPLALPGFLLRLGPVYFHLFLLGWVSQLIFGTVHWLFPGVTAARAETETLGWVTLVLLNGGLLLRVVAEPLSAGRPGSGWGWLLVLSALLQWGAGLAFVAFVWPRTRERKAARRQAEGGR